MSTLINPAAVAGEIGRLGALPPASRFLDFEDSAAAAIGTAVLDDRDERVGMTAVEARNSEEADMPDLLESGAFCFVVTVRGDTVLCLGNFARV